MFFGTVMSIWRFEVDWVLAFLVNHLWIRLKRFLVTLGGVERKSSLCLLGNLEKAK